MRSLPNDKEQMTMFYRFWVRHALRFCRLFLQCLKESIIKATGEGIHKDLATLDFRVNAENSLSDTSHVIGDSILYENGHANVTWGFDEVRLDADHVCAVCTEVCSNTYFSSHTRNVCYRNSHQPSVRAHDCNSHPSLLPICYATPRA
jgi:hypothetical protein